MARGVLYYVNWEPDQRIPATELMFSFVIQGVQVTQQEARVHLMDLSGANLSRTDLSGADITGVSLSRKQLDSISIKNVDISKAKILD